MEILRVQGSKLELLIKAGQTQELGRAHGFNSSDKTISRRHLSFIYHDQETCLQFEVLGMNPVYVYRNNELEVFRRFERGQMESGDVFCVSAKNPIWYTLRKAGDGGKRLADDAFESELAESLESGLGFNGVEDLKTVDVDVSDIDLVKEFGFVVMGHEFDAYPKGMIPDMKNWDWFLEEPGDDSEDEEETRVKVNLRGARKRKKGDRNDDEDWTGENEDDRKLMNKSKKSQNSKYVTRSKDQLKSRKAKGKSKIPLGKDVKRMHPQHLEDEDEDEGDETLGGFIVDDDNLEEEEEEELSEEVDVEEEEELSDEYDEDDD